MPLLIAPSNILLVIKDVFGDDKLTKHLRELGLIKGRELTILSFEPSGVILKVGETRLAVDRNIASRLQVEPA